MMTPTAQTLLDELDATLLQAPASWRGMALRQIVELFAAGAPFYSKEQVALFDAVMGRLIKSADRPLLAEIGNRLAPLDNGPPGILGQLARHPDIAVCGAVLQHSNSVADKDLVEAADKDRVNAQVLDKIAARGELSEAVTDVLLKRGNPALQRTVVDNPKARLSEGGFARLLVSVSADKPLAAAIAARNDVPEELRKWLDATMSQ